MKKLNAFVFPGQGSQSLGMGKIFYEEFSSVRHVFNEASEAIKIDLKKLCFTSSDAELALTENTQPALLTVSIATAQVLSETVGLCPTLTAGHSVGEYASMVLGKVITFSEAIQSVRLRGKAMQSAVPVGAGGMIAVLGLNEAQVQFLCRWACENSGYSPLAPANYNCEGQIVISGNQNVLNWLIVNFKPTILPGEVKRAKLIPLQVSAPFHCEMMKPAQEKMQHFFSTIKFKDSVIPIIQNVDAKGETRAEFLKNNLISQVAAPVRWTQTMYEIKNQFNCATIMECGHGSVLKGLFKKTDADYFKVFSTQTLEDLKTIEQYFSDNARSLN